MGLVCNWLCVHHFCSIMLEGKISTFVALSIVFAMIFPIGEYNWIYASPLQCCCLIKWKVEYLDPFEKKKACDFVFLHDINPFEIWKWSQWIFYFLLLLFFFSVVWSFGNLPFGFRILCWVCPRIGPVIVELGSCCFFLDPNIRNLITVIFFHLNRLILEMKFCLELLVCLCVDYLFL